MYWKGPTYSKKEVADSKGGKKTVQIHQFTLEEQEPHLQIIAPPTQAPHTIITETQWTYLLEQFIHSFSHLFAKPLTAQALYKLLNHDIDIAESLKTKERVNWTIGSITINSGKFIINWKISEIPIIAIELDGDDCDELKSVDDMINDSVSVDDITDMIQSSTIQRSNTNTTPRNVSYLQREKARQRVKELRLNARLAYFRAKQELRKYEERYGGYESEFPLSDDASDDDKSSLWSDEDESESDGESQYSLKN